MEESVKSESNKYYLSITSHTLKVSYKKKSQYDKETILCIYETVLVHDNNFLGYFQSSMEGF